MLKPVLNPVSIPVSIPVLNPPDTVSSERCENAARAPKPEDGMTRNGSRPMPDGWAPE